MNHYYKVTEGPTFDILTAQIEKLHTARAAARNWKNKHDLPVVSIAGTSVTFQPNFVPDKKLWKQGRIRGSFRPRESRPAGKILAEELKALPTPPGWADVLFALIQGTEKDFTQVNVVGAVGFTKATGEEAFFMRADPYWLPQDRTGLVEITASEFEAGSQS